MNRLSIKTNSLKIANKMIFCPRFSRFFTSNPNPSSNSPFKVEKIDLFCLKNPEEIQKYCTTIQTTYFGSNPQQFFHKLPQLIVPYANYEIKLHWQNTPDIAKQKWVENIFFFINQFLEIDKYIPSQSLAKNSLDLLCNLYDFSSAVELLKKIIKIYSPIQLLSVISSSFQFAGRSMHKAKSSKCFEEYTRLHEDHLYQIVEIHKKTKEMNLGQLAYGISSLLNYLKVDSFKNNEKTAVLVDFLLNIDFNIQKPSSIFTAVNSLFLAFSRRKIPLNLKNNENLEFMTNILNKQEKNNISQNEQDLIEIDETGEIQDSSKTWEFNPKTLHRFIQAYFIQNQDRWKEKFLIINTIAQTFQKLPFEESFMKYFSDLILKTDFSQIRNIDLILINDTLAILLKKKSAIPVRLKIFSWSEKYLKGNLNLDRISFYLKSCIAFRPLFLAPENEKRTEFIVENAISEKDQKIITDIVFHFYEFVFTKFTDKFNSNRFEIVDLSLRLFNVVSFESFRKSDRHRLTWSGILETDKILRISHNVFSFLRVYDISSDEEMQDLVIKIVDKLLVDEVILSSNRQTMLKSMLEDFIKTIKVDKNELTPKCRLMMDKTLEFKRKVEACAKNESDAFSD